MGKNGVKRKSSKNSLALRVKAPNRFGYENIESVRCFVCGVEQFRYEDRDGHSVRLVEVHHIYSVSECPELANDPDNMMFLCNTHHKEFHKRYDRVTDFKNGFPVTTTASLLSMQRWLNLTAKGTIEKQMGLNNVESNSIYTEDNCGSNNSIDDNVCNE